MNQIINKLKTLQSCVESLAKWERQGSMTMVNREAHYQALAAVKDHVLKYVANLVQDMKNEEVKHVGIAGCEITIRKIMADMYSGAIRRGTENIHQFDRITIPQLAGQLQSLLELYDPDKVEETKNPTELLVAKLKPLAEQAENGMVSQLLNLLAAPQIKPASPAIDPKLEVAAIIAEAQAITDEAKNRMQRVDPRVEIMDLKERVEAMLQRVESLVASQAPTSQDEDKLHGKLHHVQQKHDLLTDRVEQELNILHDKIKFVNEKIAEHKAPTGKVITITVD
jgi:hypothetical protein